MRKALGVIGLLLSSTTGTAAAETAAVAGLAPWERPAAAPLITEMAKAANWCARADRGRAALSGKPAVSGGSGRLAHALHAPRHDRTLRHPPLARR